MLLNLLQIQSIAFIVISLFIWQKRGRLENKEGNEVFLWIAAQVLFNSLILYVCHLDMSSLTLLMLASANGLATSLFLLLKKIPVKKLV